MICRDLNSITHVFFQVIFKAEMVGGNRGDIAIDGLNITEGECDDTGSE